MTKITWIVCCIMMLTASVGSAQEGRVEGSDRDDALEEVLVFATRTRAATKTDADLIEIPQSISIITAEQIIERGALNYQDVFRYAAGVDTERSGLEVRSDFFSARGFALKQYLDGMNTTPDFLYGSRLEVFMLERAEVLRGPSAVLYGAGSSGGLLNAVSKRPQFDFSGEVGLQVGNFDRKQIQADVTGPFSENVAGRIVGMARNGELLSPGQDNDKYVVMPSLTWRMGEDTELTFIALYQKEDMGTHTYLPTAKTLQADADDPPIPHNRFIGEPGFNHMDTERYAGTILFSHDFSDSISFNTSNRYLHQTVDYAEVYGFPPWEDAGRTIIGREFYVLVGDYDIFNSDTNVRFDFETGSISHRVLLGLDYTLFEHDRQEGFSCRGFTGGTCFAGGSPPGLDVYNPVYGIPFDFGFTNAYGTESTQTGLYLQDEIRWADRVTMVLGVRQDRATSERIGATKFDNDSTTYKAGIIGEIGGGFSPFLSYAESFTPLFGTDFYGTPYKPQEARQYEGGIKWQPWPGSLITASYYDIEETNFLTRDPENIQNFLQSGKIGATGYEIEAIINLENGFGLTANYSDTDAKVIEGTSTAPTGSLVPGIPDRLASVWINQTFNVSSEFVWRIGAGLRYTGKEIDSAQLVITPERTVMDVSTQVYWKDWNFSVNINNISDKEFYAACSSSTCAPAETRTMVATVTRSF